MIELEFKKNVDMWIQEGKEHLRYEYPDLNENSIVIDIGVYKGEFVRKIYEKYNCNIFGFEPVTIFFLDAMNSISRPNNKIQLFNFGISGESRIDYIYLNNDETSFHRKNQFGTGMRVNLIAFREVLALLLNGVVTIDLLKINIEGEEYLLLESMIKDGHINLVKNLQIQFHTFIKDAKERREKILENLDDTHKSTISYPFVWEFFKRREIET